MQTKTTMRRVLGAVMITVAIAPWVGGSPAAADPPSSDCPAGTTAVAKYNVSGSTYVAEFGGSLVTLSNTTASGGDFTSTVGISDVFVKGGSDGKTAHYDPSISSGSFSNAGLTNDGDQVPAISHVTFCQPNPATTSAPATTTTSAPATTTTSAPATTTTSAPATVPVAGTTTAVETTAEASVLSTKVGTTTDDSQTPEATVSVRGVKTGGGGDVLADTGFGGLPLGMALAVSLGLLLGGATLLLVPGRVTVERSKHRRRH